MKLEISSIDEDNSTINRVEYIDLTNHLIYIVKNKESSDQICITELLEYDFSLTQTFNALFEEDSELLTYLGVVPLEWEGGKRVHAFYLKAQTEELEKQFN